MAKIQFDPDGDLDKAITDYKDLYKELKGEVITKPDIVNLYMLKGMDKIEADVLEMKNKLKEIEKLKKS